MGNVMACITDMLVPYRERIISYVTMFSVRTKFNQFGKTYIISSRYVRFTASVENVAVRFLRL